MYYRNRMYDVGLGRFVSRDPIGYADGFSQYHYCLAAPMRWGDPYGLMTYAECVKGCVSLTSEGMLGNKKAAEGKYTTATMGLPLGDRNLSFEECVKKNCTKPALPGTGSTHPISQKIRCIWTEEISCRCYLGIYVDLDGMGHSFAGLRIGEQETRFGYAGPYEGSGGVRDEMDWGGASHMEHPWNRRLFIEIPCDRVKDIEAVIQKWDSKGYNLATNNCTDFVREVLDAAGVDHSTGSWWQADHPHALEESIAKDSSSEVNTNPNTNWGRSKKKIGFCCGNKNSSSCSDCSK